MSDADHGGVGSTQPGRYGAGAAQLSLSRTTIAVAWNVQGDARRPDLVAEVQGLFHVSLPTAANGVAAGDAWTALWLGPRSWLLIASAMAAGPSSGSVFEPGRDALNASGGALFDVSASRVAFSVRGERAETVLAKSCPLDLHRSAFPPGSCAQSVVGQVNALLLRHPERKQGEANAFTVMVSRSLAADTWRTLCLGAAQYGYDVLTSESFTCDRSP